MFVRSLILEADSSDVHSGISDFKCKANNHSLRRTAKLFGKYTQKNASTFAMIPKSN